MHKIHGKLAAAGSELRQQFFQVWNGSVPEPGCRCDDQELFGCSLDGHYRQRGDEKREEGFHEFDLIVRRMYTTSYLGEIKTCGRDIRARRPITAGLDKSKDCFNQRRPW